MPVSADRLIDALWGDGQVANPVNALQAQIGQLRRTALLPRVRDLGQEIEQVLAAGSRDRRRCHRRAGVPRGRRW
jgi:hypothetical protein